MAVTTDADIEPPECSTCDRGMELKAEGAERSIPLVESDVGFVRFACPGCGQGARYERFDPDEEWTKAGA